MELLPIAEASSNLISLLIKERKEFFSSNKNILDNYSLLSACKEFCTIKLCFPRRVGNTNLCLNIATSHENVAVLTFSKMHTEEFIREAKERNKFNLLRQELVTDRYSVHSISGKRDRIDIVVIDTSSLISKDKLEEVYKIFGKRCIYILVG